MPTKSALQALSILRNPSQFHWYVVPFLLVVLYIYFVEVGKNDWSRFFAGLALWGMDWFNEIWNGLVFHFTNYAPVWGTPGKTAFLILIGLNIEICFMFAIMGVAVTYALPADRKKKILGIPNRVFYAVAFSITSVIVEYLLHAAGALTWDYPWWNVKAPWLIFLIGYLPFFVVSFWVYDMESIKKKVFVTGTILGFDLACLIVFGAVLKWI